MTQFGAAAGMVEHGADMHTNVTRELFIPAISGHIRAGTVMYYDEYGVIQGGANLSEPWVYISFTVPDDFVSFGSLKAVWMCTAAAGNMYWYMNANYAAEGEVVDTHADSPAIGATATGGVEILNVQEPANPLTLAGLAAGDYIGLEFGRDGSNALDTLNAAMYLYGFLFTYTAEQ